MKKIAILTCLKSISSVCASVACFSAVNNKKGAFKVYAHEEIQVLAFFQCNGCNKPLATDKGLQEKVERIIKMPPDVIHVGVCTKRKHNDDYCPIITQMIAEFQRHDIAIAFGTH